MAPRGRCRRCCTARATLRHHRARRCRRRSSGFTRDDLIGFQQRWLRPDNAEIFVVSNLPLAEVQPQLEQRFGDMGARPRCRKGEAVRRRCRRGRPAERIVLIDRPGSPQSIILAGAGHADRPARATSPRSAAPTTCSAAASCRAININLRETKGWSYGVGGTVQLNANVVPYVDQRAGPGRPHRRFDPRALQGHPRVPRHQGRHRRGARADHRQPHQASFPASSKPRHAVLAAMQTNALYGRPDNYYELLADKYRAQTRATLDAVVPRGARPQRLRLGRRRRRRQGPAAAAQAQAADRGDPAALG